MAEKKKGKKRKEDYVPPGEEVIDKPSKEEYAVAKWMKKNVPIKKTKFLNHNVEYFTAKKAVDALLESQFATGDDALFTTREEIVNFLHEMLLHKFYHRARKVPVSEHELKSKKKEKKAIESGNEKDKQKETKEKDRNTDAENSVAEGKQELQDKEKKKKKIRLDMHNDQRFVDGLDAYVWIYDPIPFYYWIIGTLLVLGAIGICLFPLWPPSVRLGVYYLSVAAAGFLVFIIFLALVRLILFCLIWMLTFGKHHLWILPNLTEDVGFFASFWPLYQYEYKGSGNTKIKDKKKKCKDSDAEDEGDMKKDEAPSLKEEKGEIKDEGIDDENNREEEEVSQTGGSRVEAVNQSESESESSQRSSTGKDFEIVDQDELDS